MKEAKRESTNEGLEKRLENLSNILEKQFSVEEMRKSHPVEPQEKENRTEGFQFIKMLYRTPSTHRYPWSPAHGLPASQKL